MSKYKGLFTFDEDNHRYVPIAQADGIIDTMDALKVLLEEIDEAERVLMAGNREGGKKAALKIKQLHGEDFYQRIGREGGKNGHTGGFASNPELAREAGRKGGKKSRRGKSKKTLKEAEGGESAKD